MMVEEFEVKKVIVEMKLCLLFDSCNKPHEIFIQESYS